MQFRKPNAVDTKLEKVTENLLDEMLENGPSTNEYPKNLEYLQKVNAVRNSIRRPALNPNQVLLVIGNIIIPVIVVAYEQKHVWTSKVRIN